MAGRDGDYNPSARSQIQDTLRKLRKHAWIPVLAAAVAVGVSVYYTRQQQPTYASGAEVLVKSPNIAPATSAAPLVNMATETEVAESEAVASLAHEKMGEEAEVGGVVSVRSPPGTDILSFEYRSSDPQVAQQGAQAFAEAYLEFRRDRAAGELLDILGFLGEKMTEAREELRSINDRLTVSDTQSERLTLRAQGDALAQEIQGLRSQSAAYSSPEALQAGYIVEDAGLGTEAAPPLRRNALVAFVLGLGFGAAIVLLRDRFGGRVTDGVTLESALGEATLAAVPPSPRVKGGVSFRMLPTLFHPGSGAAEAYRHLAASVLFSASSQGHRVILITSPNEGEGKSVTTANLAISLTKSHQRVTMIDADLRDPSLHGLFYASNEEGLSTTLLSGKGSIDGYVWVGVEDLRLIPAGPPVFDPGQLLSGKRMESLVEGLRDDCDLVLIDAPPVLPVADALLVARLADSVLVVADAGRSTVESVSTARRHVEQVGASVMGGVLNRSADDVASAYGRYGGALRRVEVPAAVAEVVDIDERGRG